MKEILIRMVMCNIIHERSMLLPTCPNVSNNCAISNNKMRCRFYH